MGGAGPEHGRAALRIRLLGTYRVGVDGHEAVIGARKPRAVLAMLATGEGRPITAETLIDGLWGDEPPDTARTALQVYVAGLRRALGAAGPRLRTDGGGYVLDIDPADVDVLAFESAVEAARRTGDATSWHAALDLWSGDPFPDLAGVPWADMQGPRLRETWLAALDQRFDADLALGRHAELIADLEGRVVAEPYRERTWRQLILALYRDGRQSDALGAYRRVRRLLADDLGLDPGPALQALEQAILNQDPELDLGRHDEALGFRVPRPATALEGRKGELADVVAAVRSGRLTTLVGPGGVGKTRLAMEVAQEVSDAFAGGIVFVDLASVRETPLMLAEVARAVGAGGAEDPVDALVARLGDRPTLLVLDNLEQVPHADREVSRLLDRVIGTHVLATSRTVLRIRAEGVVRLGALPPAEAARLFTARAAAAGRTTDDAVAYQIAERLDGLPLAIELAAASCRALSPAAVLERLLAHAPLPAGPRDLPDRQRTIEGALAWSADLLEPEGRALLADVAIFESPFTFEAVAAVHGTDDVESLTELVDASLLVVDGERYRMLQSIREFANTLLEREAAESLADRHAAWVLATSLAAVPVLHSPQEVGARTALAAILPDLRAAIRRFLETGRSEEAAQVLLATRIMWFHEGLFREVEAGLRLAAKGELSPLTAAEAGVMLEVFAKVLGMPGAIASLTVATDQLRDVAPDSVTLVSGLCHLGSLLAEEGRAEEAFRVSDEAVEVARVCDDLAAYAMALDLAGYVARTLGDPDRALRASEAAVEVARTSGSSQLPSAMAGLSAALAQSGRIDEGVAMAWETLEVAERRSPQQLAEVGSIVAPVLAHVDPAAAAGVLARTLATYLATGAAPSSFEAAAKLTLVAAEAGGDREDLVVLLGAIEARRADAPEALGAVAGPLRERLGAREYARLHAAGLSLDDDGLARLGDHLARSLAAAGPSDPDA